MPGQGWNGLATRTPYGPNPRGGEPRSTEGGIVTKFTRSIVAIASVLGVGLVLAGAALATGATGVVPAKGRSPAKVMRTTCSALGR
jgi:hypothetical protein